MAVWTTILVPSVIAWTPSTVLTALHFIGCLDYKFSHISGCQDTIKSTYSAALHWLFGLLVYLNQSLSGHIKLRIALPFSGCLATSLVKLVAAWREAINCFYSAAPQRLFRVHMRYLILLERMPKLSHANLYPFPARNFLKHANCKSDRGYIVKYRLPEHSKLQRFQILEKFTGRAAFL
ncbi:hypothetical protein TNCT_271351 [Trichonephila clavata]|uniref:Uncharacterized protein n=1 Tax=Trichonephila clavata TaxID=2740835 RepID=A0A8X6L0B4_TRICU|nr:hypothetical protein TNCT_271351 [Trichonephila clavata]